MPDHSEIKNILINKKIGDTTSICGWVKTFRSNRFININDGSCIEDLQCVVELDNFDKNILSQINSCLLYTSPSPRDFQVSRMPSSA